MNAQNDVFNTVFDFIKANGVTAVMYTNATISIFASEEDFQSGKHACSVTMSLQFAHLIHYDKPMVGRIKDKIQTFDLSDPDSLDKLLEGIRMLIWIRLNKMTQAMPRSHHA